MASESPKRVVPSSLRHLLNTDIKVTELFCKAADKIFPPKEWKKNFKFLEVSCHAFPWVTITMALMWIFWNPSYFQLQVNLLFGLIFDLLCLTFVKAAVRRRRPKGNSADMFLSIGPDQYSFPSGHVSRACFLAFFFTYLYPVNFILRVFVYVWVLAVSVSRILLRRHHILDVVGGVVLGLLEGIIMSYLWLSESSCKSLVTYLTEEAVNLEGLQDQDFVNDEL